MKLSNYIDFIITSKKSAFRRDIELDEAFDKNDLMKLCTLSIKRKRLIEAWSVIIDLFNEFHFNDASLYFTSNVLDFLIDNDICVCDLGHLMLPPKYLQRIYDKDNNNWEAKRNLELKHKEV